jgi:MFS family permease
VGLSGSVLGLGLAVLRAASLLALPLASLADRRGRLGVVRVALGVGLLATALAALSPGYWFFVACFALARPLLTATSALVQVVTVELSSHARRVAHLALVAAGSGIGIGLSAILHSLVRGPDSFRWLFAAALVPLAATGWLTRSLPEPRVHPDDLPLARLGAVARAARGRLGIVAAVSFALGVVTGPANGFAFVYAEGVLKISPGVVATVVTSSALTGLMGLYFSRRLAHAWGRRATVALGVVVTSGASVLAYGAGRMAFVVGYLVGVGAAGLLAPAAAALTTEIFARAERATAAGWVVVAGVLGAVAGLFLFGAVGDAAHHAGAGSLRVAALVTFVPLSPVVALLARLHEGPAHDLA